MITITITEKTTTIQEMIYCLQEVINRLENGTRLSYDPDFEISGTEQEDTD